MDDAALVEAARSGHDTAWAAIYDRYADKLHDHCFRILRDRDEAADALHDAFLAAARNLEQLRDPARLRPWLYAICRHTSLRRLRARDRVELTDAPDDLMAAEPDLDRGVRAQELGELVWAAAAGLSGRDQALLDLHLRQGLDGQDLADAMGTSLSNSYVMLSRMRDQVERSLGALLIARLGRDDCADLDRILQGWDGRFSPLLRKRVARHVDGCEICSERKRAVASPLALLAAAPLVPAPAALKARVISSIRSGDVPVAPRVRFTRDGFAALGAVGAVRPGRGVWAAAAAVALALLLGGGILAAAGSDGDQAVETAAADTPAERRERERARLEETDGAGDPAGIDEVLAPVAGEEPASPDGGADGAVLGSGGPGGPGAAPGGGTDGVGPGGPPGPGGTGGGTAGGTAGGTGGTAGGDGSASPPPSDPTTTTTANDGFGPALSELRVSPGDCGTGGRTVTLTITAVDPAGVRSASVTPATRGVSPTGKTAMQRGAGDTWRKVLTVPRGGGSFSVVIEAVDGDGVDTDDPFQFRVDACPTPG